MIPYTSDSVIDRKIALYSLSFNEKLFELLDNGELKNTALANIKQHITIYITTLSRTEEEKNTLLGELDLLTNDIEQNSKGDVELYYLFLDQLLERKKSKIKMINSLFTENKQAILQKPIIDLSQEELDEYIFEDFSSPEPTLTPTSLSYVFDLTIFNRDGSPLVFKGEGIPTTKLSTTQTNSGKGSFGVVHKYSTQSLQRDESKFNYMVKFAIPDKKGKIDDGNERKANQALRTVLREQQRRCDIIHGRVITSSSLNHFAILMPMMDGDIYKLDISNWNLKSRLKLLESVRSQMECIIKLNSDEDLENPLQKTFKFAYLDLKPANILFKRRANGELTYKLGDLGSIVQHDEKQYPGEFMSTLPVHIFEEKKGKHLLIRSDYNSLQFPGSHIVKCMRYVFGVLAHMLSTRTLQNHAIYQSILKLDEVKRRNQEIIDHYGEDYSNLMYDTSKATRLSMYG